MKKVAEQTQRMGLSLVTRQSKGLLSVFFTSVSTFRKVCRKNHTLSCICFPDFSNTLHLSYALHIMMTPVQIILDPFVKRHFYFVFSCKYLSSCKPTDRVSVFREFRLFKINSCRWTHFTIWVLSRISPKSLPYVVKVCRP